MKNFDERVWKMIKKIPRGKVTSYKIIAEKLGTRAYRAVGNACNRNPFAPRVPCHRVVNNSGNIGGYAHPLQRKILLLEKEGIQIEGKKIKNFNKVLFRF